jgi:hypothetical protein
MNSKTTNPVNRIPPRVSDARVTAAILKKTFKRLKTSLAEQSRFKKRFSPGEISVLRKHKADKAIGELKVYLRITEAKESKALIKAAMAFAKMVRTEVGKNGDW